MIKIGFAVALPLITFGPCTFGVGFCFGLGGLIPMCIGLKNVFDYSRIYYSFFPVVLFCVTISASAAVFHSIGYWYLISNEMTRKEASELGKSKVLKKKKPLH